MLYKNKKAVLFLLCQGISLFGSSIVQFAIIWYVTIKTSSGIWVALLTVASYLPQFIISFFAGVWCDKMSKKKLIIMADVGIAIATIILICLFSFIKYDLLLLISLLVISVIRSLGSGIQTPAVNAAIPEIVEKESLMKFNGINVFIASLVQFVAPILAGIVLSFLSFPIALLIDIFTAFLGVTILVTIKLPFVKKETSDSLIKEMKAGIKYATNNKFIGTILITFGIFIFLCVPVGFLSALFVNRYYGDTYFDLSIVEVIGFIGMTIGGLIIGTWGGFKKRTITLIVGMFLFGVLGVLMGVINNFIIYLAFMFTYGICLTMVQTAYTTLLQENTDEAMQGRIFGLFQAMFSGFLPLGMLAFGPLVDIIPFRIVITSSGILLIIMVIILFSNKKFMNYHIAKKEMIKNDN